MYASTIHTIFDSNLLLICMSIKIDMNLTAKSFKSSIFWMTKHNRSCIRTINTHINCLNYYIINTTYMVIIMFIQIFLTPIFFYIGISPTDTTGAIVFCVVSFFINAFTFDEIDESMYWILHNLILSTVVFISYTICLCLFWYL